MTNSGKYPTMVGNCCLTNAFDTSSCFGEALLREDNKGALGHIGSYLVRKISNDFPKHKIKNKAICHHCSFEKNRSKDSIRKKYFKSL